MKEEHIFNILDNTAFADLSESELSQIKTHAAHCKECSRAFQAAQASSVMLKTHASQAFEPSPFFEKRVMAALRERQAKNESPFAALWRLWRASGALVSGMAAMVAVLFALTFFAPNTNEAIAQNSFFGDFESVILNENSFDPDMTDEQVFETIYGEAIENAENEL